MESYIDIIVESMVSEISILNKGALIGGGVGAVAGGAVGHLIARKQCRKKWGNDAVGYKACIKRKWFGPLAKKEPEQKKK